MEKVWSYLSYYYAGCFITFYVYAVWHFSRISSQRLNKLLRACSWACKIVVYGQGQRYCLFFFFFFLFYPFLLLFVSSRYSKFPTKSNYNMSFFFEFKLLKNIYFLYIESLLWAQQSALNMWMPSMVLRHAPLECERLVYDCTLHLFTFFLIWSQLLIPHRGTSVYD